MIVATRLVHPATMYRLRVGSDDWTYANPLRLADDGTTADITIDPGNPRTDTTERARADFWECVAGCVVWPDGSDVAAEILARAKVAERGRLAADAGHIDLFPE